MKRFDLSDGGESHLASGLWVSGDFFRVLGVPAMHGRVLSVEDDRRGGPAVAVISYNFWQRNFPGQSNVVGESIRLNRQTFEIIGVTPPWFTGLDKDKTYDVAISIGNEPMLRTDRSALDNRSWWWLTVLGRLAPGQSLERAQSHMTALAPEVFKATLPSNWPSPAQGKYLKNSFVLKPAATGFSPTGNRYRTALFTLMAIVGVVLLIACANIANLLLARAAARQREFSMRMAIGASRWRVIRQQASQAGFTSAQRTKAFPLPSALQHGHGLCSHRQGTADLLYPFRGPEASLALRPMLLPEGPNRSVFDDPMRRPLIFYFHFLHESAENDI